jgi:hypothetical protein
MKMRRIEVAVATALSTAALAAAAAPMSPPRPAASQAAPVARAAVDPDDVAIPTATAVVVKSWGECSSNFLVWQTLNNEWEQYGSVRVRIDFDNPQLCADSATITYDALVASGAQTVILSDPVGGGAHIDASEAAALQRYAQEGHNLIGTFLLLEYLDGDNRALAPLFGLSDTLGYRMIETISPEFQLRPNAPLFDGLGGSYTTSGYLSSQAPVGQKWTNEVAYPAKVVAYDAHRAAAILRHCGAGYRAYYFTHMPEYSSTSRFGVQDAQVLYNAIVDGRKPGCPHE